MDLLPADIRKVYGEARNVYRKLCICYVCGKKGHNPGNHTQAEIDNPLSDADFKAKTSGSESDRVAYVNASKALKEIFDKAKSKGPPKSDLK